jgi:hypothetical protein
LGKEKPRKSHIKDYGKYKPVTHEYQSEELQLEANENSGKMKIVKSVMRRQFTSNLMDMKRFIKRNKHVSKT